MTIVAKRGVGVLLAGVLFCACGAAGTDGESSAPLIGGLPGVAEATPSVYIFDAGCSGTLITSRLILTAAHCLVKRDGAGLLTGTPRSQFTFNARVSLSNSSIIDGTAAWFDVPVLGASIHPGWVSACAGGCAEDAVLRAPFPPDLAVLALQQPVPASWGLPAWQTSANVGNALFVTGYGCEDKVGGNAPNPPRFKLGTGVVVDPAAANPAPEFAASYFVMPGQNGGGTASLCVGDSGGPTFKGLFGGGNGGWVAGVNAYYTFAGNSGGVSVMNVFARVDTQSARNFVGGAVNQWDLAGSTHGVDPMSSYDYCAGAKIMCSIGRKREYLILAKHCMQLDGVPPSCQLADPGPTCDAAAQACAANDAAGWTALSRDCTGLGGVAPPCDLPRTIDLIGITSPAPRGGGGRPRLPHSLQ